MSGLQKETRSYYYTCGHCNSEGKLVPIVKATKLQAVALNSQSVQPTQE